MHCHIFINVRNALYHTDYWTVVEIVLNHLNDFGCILNYFEWLKG